MADTPLPWIGNCKKCLTPFRTTAPVQSLVEPLQLRCNRPGCDGIVVMVPIGGEEPEAKPTNMQHVVESLHKRIFEATGIGVIVIATDNLVRLELSDRSVHSIFAGDIRNMDWKELSAALDDCVANAMSLLQNLPSFPVTDAKLHPLEWPYGPLGEACNKDPFVQSMVKAQAPKDTIILALVDRHVAIAAHLAAYQRRDEADSKPPIPIS